MANQITAAASARLLEPLVAGTLKAILLSQTAPISAPLSSLSQITQWRVGEDQTLEEKSVDADGIFRCANLTWDELPDGTFVSGVAFYLDTGDPESALPVILGDTVAGLPRSVSGGSFTLAMTDGLVSLRNPGA